MSSFYTTLTGLNAFHSQIEQISNNMANVETTAYKSNNISFEEVLTNTMTLNSASSVVAGKGVKIMGSTACWEQGDLTETGNTNDLAISGEGFFIASDDYGTYYTRDGSFKYDEDGLLVNNYRMAVQGYAINEDGTLGNLGDIQLSTAPILPTATSEITTQLNLNSGTGTAETFDTTVSVYDSLGNEIPMEITFTKTATANQWTWAAGIPAGSGSTVSAGTITFDNNGNLAASTKTINLTLTNGATSPQAITWDIAATDLTQYASDSRLAASSQDGNATGTLAKVTVNDDGIITGTYSNGEIRSLYQVALALFSNNDGLDKVDNSLYVATGSSGAAVIGAAGTDQYGSITAGALEVSNVDMAAEMADLVIAQRAYEACAKLMTAESEIMQTTVNMT
ncbi:flagellar hook protein FlgE [Syntrophus sp. (in: bacteria)]|uniref:flagellar hook protein FlgE n=1 Tax=Syntrophus sp. (in: bacteria) TaxID=48412 RepID=UPI00345EE824